METPHPNKTFVADFVHEGNFGKSKHTVIVAARDKQTAEDYLYNKLGIRPALTWLMGCDHEIIRDQKGNAEEVQAKILFNTYCKTL